MPANTGAAFKDYLEQLQSINDEEWSSSNIRTELSRALGIIENSRLEFNRGRTKLDCLDPKADQPDVPVEAKSGIDWPELLRYARLGAAASAPLIIAGTIWLIVLVAFKHWHQERSAMSKWHKPSRPVDRALSDISRID